MVELMTATGAEDAVVADLGAAAREHMLEKAVEKLDSRHCHTPDQMSAVISVAETDLIVVNRFQAAVGNGDTKHVAAEIIQNLVAGAGMFQIHDPVFLPDRRGNLLEETCFLESGTDLSAENDR